MINTCYSKGIFSFRNQGRLKYQVITESISTIKQQFLLYEYVKPVTAVCSYDWCLVYLVMGIVAETCKGFIKY
jgi:hypothetical protein